jgi:hypothetical protein
VQAGSGSLDAAALRILDSAAQISRDVRRSTDGLTPVELVPDVAVTHYGPSFNGQKLGCSEARYASDNGGIIAVGPERSAEWPCGTVLRVCGPGGCMVGERQDGCPGCDAYHIDVSEEGLYLVCGPGSGVCRASIEVFAPSCGVLGASDVAGSVENGPNAELRLLAELAEAALADRTANLLDIGAGESPDGVCSVQAP